MCTAVSFSIQNSNRRFFYFGRTLDNDRSYGEQTVIVPRNFPLAFLHRAELSTHAAFIGTALVHDGTPLFYDAVNEYGLAVAALNFPKSAYYEPYRTEMGEHALGAFELIPFLLGTCETVIDVRKALTEMHIVDAPFSEEIPPTPLHFLVSDGTETLAVEPTREGLRLYKNTLGVLTNEPPFPMQMSAMQGYRNLSADVPPSFLDAALPPIPGFGLGAVGLPGDFSSPSRFARAAFVRHHMLSAMPEGDFPVQEMFHLFNTVFVPRGVCVRDDGAYQHTAYTAVADARSGLYYKTTYEDPVPCVWDLWSADLDGNTLQ